MNPYDLVDILRAKLAGRYEETNIIPFYYPEKYYRKVKWIPEEQRGKLLQFPSPHEEEL
jgi:hypothetical protein